MNKKSQEWVLDLTRYDVTQNDVDMAINDLRKQFNREPSTNDVVWRLLNSLTIKAGSHELRNIYWDMACVIAAEGKRSPRPYLEQANRTLFGHDELIIIRDIRKNIELDMAENLLLAADPSPAVLDELRKISSERARIAMKNGDWKAVIEHLENYEKIAKENEEFCVNTVNQRPPAHTPSDKKIMDKARKELNVNK